MKRIINFHHFYQKVSESIEGDTIGINPGKDLYAEVERGQRGGNHLADDEVNKLRDILSEDFRLYDKWTHLTDIDDDKLNNTLESPFVKGPNIRIVLFQRKGKPQMTISFTKQMDDWYVVSMSYFKDENGDWAEPFKCKGLDTLLTKVRSLYEVNRGSKPY